jgi:hypothetical protein
LGKATECAQDCTTAIGLLEQAHATLQAAPGAATEAELQAVMLGAVAPAATAAVPEPAPASMGDATDGDNALEATSSTVVSQAAGEQAPAGPSVQAEIDSNSISSSSMCTVRVQQQQAHTGMDAKLKQLLVKLLARRATAYVELEQLQEAADDLQQALRWVHHCRVALVVLPAPFHGSRLDATTKNLKRCCCGGVRMLSLPRAPRACPAHIAFGWEYTALCQHLLIWSMVVCPAVYAATGWTPPTRPSRLMP